MKKSNQEESRQHNSRLVLNTIYHSGEISRVDVARQTKLTRTTVSEIVAEFVADGMVIESGLSPSRGGKPATLLRVDNNARLLIGVDLAESEFCGALIDLRGNILQQICTPVAGSDGENALARLYELLTNLLRLADRPVIGIGIGVPGLMAPANRMVRQAVHLDWLDLPLGDLLQARFDLPIYLANDCQVAALGEFTFGERPQSDNLLVIKAGRGVGAGIVLNGQLFYGDHAGAGEIGHIQVDPHGELCRCGQYGCLEIVVSSRALIEKAQRLAAHTPDSPLGQLLADPIEINLEMVAQALYAGDFGVATVIEEIGRILGSTVNHLVCTLNIEQIRIAGDLSRFGEALVAPIQQKIQRGTLPALAEKTKVSLATLGEEIVILGAASLILKNELGLF